jgi:integrase
VSADARTLAEIRKLLGASEDLSGPTFGEIWRPYYRQEGRHRRSAKRINQHGVHLLAAWADKPALRCNTEAAEEYRDARKAALTYKGRPPTPATINRELACARRACQWALEQKPALLPYNPLAAVALEEENNVRQIGHRSEDDLQTLLSYANDEERAAILLYIDCGPRRMEVLSLQWSQILMARVKVDQMVKSRPVIHLWKTKTSERRIGITWRTYQALQALPRVDRFVFPGRGQGRWGKVKSGTHLHPDSFGRRIQKLTKQAGLLRPDGHPLTIHDFRHWFAYAASVVYGRPRRQVKKQMGHRTDSTFDRYGIGGEEEVALMYEDIEAELESRQALNTKRKP